MPALAPAPRPRFARGPAQWLAALLAAAVTTVAAAQPAPYVAPEGNSSDGLLLSQPARLTPARYRVLVVPGSGCVSLAASAERLLGGLAHAQAWLLQKPHLHATAADAEAGCSPAFLLSDRHDRWLAAAIRLASQALADSDPTLPLLLVGLSEGAELLPALAQRLPGLALLVVVGNAGLDPMATGALQAERLGEPAAWQSLLDSLDRAAATQTLQGRLAGYWQVLRSWPLEAPLLADPRPLLQVWGGQDALIPPPAYARFGQAARQRPGGYCAVVFPAADHELREGPDDRLQTLWSWLEQMAREGRGWQPDCAAWQAAAARTR